MSGTIAHMAFVPGLPHLLAANPAPGWRTLADGVKAVGNTMRAEGVESLLVISTQWISVLGIQVQVRPELQGTRVDENWYAFDFGTLPYALQTDVPLADAWLRSCRDAGFQARATQHPHFPIDTGVIVASRLLDPESRWPIAQASLNLYGSADDVALLGQSAREAIERCGRRVGVVAIGGLSSHPFRTWIEPTRDDISRASDARCNRQVLDSLTEGDFEGLARARDGLVQAAAMDGQLRTLSFLHGAGDLSRPGQLVAEGAIWGMGGAVVQWPLAERASSKTLNNPTTAITLNGEGT